MRVLYTHPDGWREIRSASGAGSITCPTCGRLLAVAWLSPDGQTIACGLCRFGPGNSEQ